MSTPLQRTYRLPAISSILVAAVLGALVATQVSHTAAQESANPDPAARESANQLSADERDRAYAELDRDLQEPLMLKLQGINKRVVDLTRPSVVHIEAKKNREYQRRHGIRADVEEAGSGVVINLNGDTYILTNRHVIRDSDAKDIRIQLNDGREVRPTRIWEDTPTDVAVLSLSQDVPNLIPARLGDSQKVEIGDFVLAVGSPFGLSQSVTFGIISAKGRFDLDLGDGEVEYQNFLQSDAAINPGNSGGPLINLRGQVVGLNTAIASSGGGNEGIGFSIPINTAMSIAKQLVKHGKVSRAFLGVTLDASYQSNGVRGAKVKGTTPGSPADNSGIVEDDIIISFDNTRIVNDAHLINVVALTEVGRSVRVIVLRDGQRVPISVVVGDRSVFTTASNK